ncbi:MAG: type VI secretion system membrane subunit TssM [Pseudomonadota bacterium]
MRRLWQFLTDSRVLGAFGLGLLAAFLILGAQALQLAAVWAGVAALALLLAWCAFWLGRHAWRKRAAAKLSAGALAAANESATVAVLRKNIEEAIGTIKTSKLGIVSGAAALYELPWYMVIGNPAAGKSSAIGHSGLQFPLAGAKALQGVGGTRNCDWFFTSDGIVLDTAGRYSVEESERSEWLGFLDLLRRHRRRAPINGILIAVSVAELTGGTARDAMELAKSLRTRVQELTERLRVYAPVYVIFTKADLIAGFIDFFHDTGRAERERIWGATCRYNRRRSSTDVLAFFDQHFDELHDGLKEMSLASMAHQRGARMRPGVFTFPLEFANIKSHLRAFLATLFEENTYQFKPVFRGFYFTSALQEGAATDLSSKRVADRFDLDFHAHEEGVADEQSGYFLYELFRKVIFADKDLVRRYTSPAARRLKYGAFFAATLMLGGAMAAWSWSYMGNGQLIDAVQADLERVVKLQDKRTDLQSRLEGLDILQDRIEQLDKYRASGPVMVSFGLYQGDALERKLRDEYFAGVREVMLQPVASGIEALLAEMNANAAQLDPNTQGAPARPGQAYQDASPTNIADAYNALKAYLMLGDKSHAEAGHLNDQLTRYWRGWLEANRGTMPREQMIRSAERLMTFHLNQIADPGWPQLTLKLGLLDAARENLRHVVRGTPARERVYADIKARAGTRYAPMTVARIVGEQDQNLVVGSYAVPGAFTREAWEKYVQGAIREVANKELQSTDWVLKTVSNTDLTVEGSPEQIQKALVDMYKADYVQSWVKFVQGVSIKELSTFEASVQAMNRLGDAQASPIARLLKAIHSETSWDGPGGSAAQTAAVENGLLAWFKESILRRAPSEMRDTVNTDGIKLKTEGAGPIGREFAGVARLLGLKDKDASLMTGYLDCLSRLRTRLNQLKNQGDPGPGAKQLMQQTLEGTGSELADALKYVDEQMLTGMADNQKQALRPLLVRPLIQTFGMIVQPSEAEINKTWQAQVLEPFQKTLAVKYPFEPGSKVEASSAEIGQFFGPDGVVAKFVNTAMGPLVVRRGDVLAPRTWADVGITLVPQAVSAFPGWVAPLSANGVAASSGPQTVFQLMPQLAPGVAEFSIEIDGQQLRYKNTTPAWTNMVHPSAQGVPGARIAVQTLDGRSVELFNEAGQFGLKRMIDAATRKRKDGGVFELRWTNGNVSVAVDLKIVSNTEAGGDASASRGFQGMRLPPAIVGRAPDAPVLAKGGAQ